MTTARIRRPYCELSLPVMARSQPQPLLNLTDAERGDSRGLLRVLDVRHRQ